MWALYDTLIEGIPGGVTVAESLLGCHWAGVRSSEGGVGLAMRYDITPFPSALNSNVSGLPLRELARSVKSWNFIDAAYGAAAINAWYNQPERAASRGIDLSSPSRAHEAFRGYRAALAGSKTAVVGHFPYLEQLLRPVCELSILERNPQAGDFPDPACEYLLPEQDYVFITGSALVNKTLPRLLRLCRGTYAVLVGPSVPLAPALFDFGVHDLSGFVVLDAVRCFNAVRGGIEGGHFDSGTMVHYTKAVTCLEQG